MREIIKTDKVINFMRLRFVAIAMSSLLVLASITSLAINGLNFGLDFTGGTLIQVSFSESADLNSVRQKLSNNGFGDAVVQTYGSQEEILIRLEPRDGVSTNEVGNSVMAALQDGDTTSITLQRIEFVGSAVGDELKEQGGLAVFSALICILIYIGIRFEWRLSLGAVAALTHDVILTLGLFSFLQLEFNMTVLAALLAVIGYSINDTVVIFDRIRENFRKLRKPTPEEIINISTTQTMSRTIITSGTTIMVLLALFFLGGELIHGFATALLFGIGIGTYSSIYVASAIALMIGVSRDDLMPTEVEKEGADQDPLP